MASVSNSAAAAKDDNASAWKTIKQRLEMLVKRVDAGGGNNESKSLRRGSEGEHTSCAWQVGAPSFLNTLLHSLRVGWRNLPTLCEGWRIFFSSCAVVSVFGSGGK